MTNDFERKNITYRILYECLRIIEFIKQVWEKREMLGLTSILKPFLNELKHLMIQ